MSSIADLKNHSGPLHIQHTPSLNWSTLQCSEHQNVQTQEQFLSPSNPSHEHLTIIMAYTIYTLIHFFICTSIAHNIPVHTKLSIVIYLYIQLSICILLFRIYLFFFLSVPYSVTVILLHCVNFCHENKFHVCVNIPSNKAHSDSDSDYVSFILMSFYSRNMMQQFIPHCKICGADAGNSR